MEQKTTGAPHVVFLPFPVQGHIKPMLALAKILCQTGGFQATFINSENNHERLQRFANTGTAFPALRFLSIPDGLPPEHPRSGPQVLDLFGALKTVFVPELRRRLISLSNVTCIISDGIMSSAIEIAEEIGIPVITFRTFSAYCFWSYCHLAKLVEAGEVPFQGDSDLDKTVTSVPGFEDIFRRRDLPGICRTPDANHPMYQHFVNETKTSLRASVLLLNTFESLESPMISKLSTLFPKVYSIGPLHGLFKNLIEDPSASSNAALRQEDDTCLKWLESKPPKSVIYVSFGSLVSLSREQVLEFWYGLVNSGSPFLWVLRTDLIAEGGGIGEIPEELKNGTKERGCIVKWAPQEEVLAHPATGGFLTHGGWNSILESVFEGVPMICWPGIGDQHVNSRCVEKIWKIGFDMKDTCDRSIIETTVRNLMENHRKEIANSMAEVARTARESVNQAGSSYCNLQKLIDDIRCLSPGVKK